MSRMGQIPIWLLFYLVSIFHKPDFAKMAVSHFWSYIVTLDSSTIHACTSMGKVFAPQLLSTYIGMQ